MWMEFLEDFLLDDQSGVGQLSVSLSFRIPFPLMVVGRVVEGRFLGQPCSEKIGNCGFTEELGFALCLTSVLPWSSGPGLEQGRGLSGLEDLETAPWQLPLWLRGVSGAQVSPSFLPSSTSYNCCPTLWRWCIWEYKPTWDSLSLFPADIGPVTLTADPAVFQRELRELYVQVGRPTPGCLSPGPFPLQA